MSKIKEQLKDLTVEQLVELQEKSMKLMKEKLPPHTYQVVEETISFRKSLSGESDRACSLMAVAYLDEQLLKLIEARLVANKKLVSKVFDMNGALGTFSSRIDFAFLLGLIPLNAQKDLHTLRKIRNEFAHDPKPLDFESSTPHELCKNLYFDGRPRDDKPAGKYRRAVMGLLALIQFKTFEVEHIEVLPEYDVSKLHDWTIEAISGLLPKQ